MDKHQTTNITRKGKNQHIVVITQARMTSTRLPGKIYKHVLGKPLLAYHIERLQQVKQASHVVVATTMNQMDNPVADLAYRLKVGCFRGSEEDVLNRFQKAADDFKADVVVRVTSDCPLIDPRIIDDLISFYINSDPPFDYASNVMVRSYPRGMDAEIFSRSALEIAAKEAQAPHEREHVTPFLYNNSQRFRLGSLLAPEDMSAYRLTVDTAEDFELIRRILESLIPKKNRFGLADIIALLRENPSWALLNQKREQQHLMQEFQLRMGSK